MNVAYVYPGQGLMQRGIGLELLKHKFYGEEIAAPMLNTANEMVRSPPFNLQHHLQHYWENGSEEQLRDTFVTHLSVFTLCSAVQAGLEHRLGEAGIVFNEKYCAGLSLGRYCVLPFKEETVCLTGSRGLELRDTPKGSGLVGWKKSLLEANPGFELDPSGYTLVRVIGLDEGAIEAVAEEAGVQVSNYNAPALFNISGSRRNLANAANFAKARGAKHVHVLNLPPFHNETLMAGFENSFGGIAKAEKTRYGRDRLDAVLISDSARRRMSSYSELFEDAGPHGRYSNRWVDAAAALAELDAAVVVIGFSSQSARAMQSLLGKKQQAIAAYDPESIDAAVSQIINLHKRGSL